MKQLSLMVAGAVLILGSLNVHAVENNPGKGCRLYKEMSSCTYNDKCKWGLVGPRSNLGWKCCSKESGGLGTCPEFGDGTAE